MFLGCRLPMKAPPLGWKCVVSNSCAGWSTGPQWVIHYECEGVTCASVCVRLCNLLLYGLGLNMSLLSLSSISAFFAGSWMIRMLNIFRVEHAPPPAQKLISHRPPGASPRTQTHLNAKCESGEYACRGASTRMDASALTYMCPVLDFQVSRSGRPVRHRSWKVTQCLS